MSAFRDQSWSSRFGALGDQAETAFEYVYENHAPRQKVQRFGLNRPAISLAGVPDVARHAPDYITNKGWVEVQGFGKDQTFKVKQTKLAALDSWDILWRIDWWAWDSHNNRYCWVYHQRLAAALEARTPDGVFDPNTSNPKAYWSVSAAELGELSVDGWHVVELGLGA